MSLPLAPFPQPLFSQVIFTLENLTQISSGQRV
jgi:hypothetical protein